MISKGIIGIVMFAYPTIHVFNQMKSNMIFVELMQTCVNILLRTFMKSAKLFMLLVSCLSIEQEIDC